MPFTRSDAICTESGQREQFNIVTAFTDGSNIYGSDVRRAEGLRTMSKGFLRTHTQGPTLPSNKQARRIDPIGPMEFVAGDIRATEQPGLASIHSLFVLEHNRLATLLSSFDSSLLDEELYQRSRRLVIGQIQNIVYGEFLPIVLGPTTMQEYGLNLPAFRTTTTYDKSVNPGIFNEFATFAFRFGHSLIPDFFKTAKKPLETTPNICPLKDTFFKIEECVMGKDSSGKAWQNLILGISTSQSPPMDAKIEESISNFLFCQKCNIIDGFGQDLAARNIQRGRDHGLPGYNHYRHVQIYCIQYSQQSFKQYCLT